MKVNPLLLNLILILFCKIVVGQEQTIQQKNNLKLSIGYNIGALKNLEIAPVSRYDYMGLVCKLYYQRTTKNQNLFEIYVDYLGSELRTKRIPILNLDYNKMGLGFSYLKKTYAKNKFSLYLGLHSQSNVSLYSKSKNYRHFISQQFGLGSRFSYQINEKQRLSSRLIIPIVLFRLTHASSGTDWLNSYQGVLWSIGYEYSLSNRFNIHLSYDFNYDRLQISNTFRELQYQLNLGINFKF